MQAKAPQTSVWDLRLGQYLHAANGFVEHASHHDSEFVRVDATALAKAGREEAIIWVYMLNNAMRKEDLRPIKVRHFNPEAMLRREFP